MSRQTESLNRIMRVLVVEDEPRLRDVLVRAIIDMGFDASAVSRGADALLGFSDNPPDMVVLDLNLPDMDGLEVFERAHGKWPKTQFIILTGFGTVEAAQQAIRLNVVDFLTKPAALSELDIALDRARRRRMGNIEPANRERNLPAPEAPEPRTLYEIEKATILETLQRHNGIRSAAAAELGISIRKLYYRLAEYEEDGPDPVRHSD